MSRIFAALPVATTALCLLSLGAAPSGPAEALGPDQQDLSVAGAWTFNVEKSDDARERMSAAMGADRVPFTMGRAGRSGGGRVGGRSGGRGGSMDPPTGGGAPQMQRGAMAMLQGPRELRIEFTETSVILHRDGGDALEVPTDGKALTMGPEGNRIEHKAKWNGKKLELETRVEDGPRVSEAFELDKNDPGILKVEVRFTNPSPAGNLNVHLGRVYDRG